MLYRANKDTKRICLSVRFNNGLCGCEEVALELTPLCCDEPPEYEYRRTPCGDLYRVEKEREQTLTLRYTMFDRNERGDICFLLDSQFSSLACGRYSAKLIACGCEVYNFQIDKRDTVTVSQVQMDDRSNCCEGKYGC